MGVAIALAVLLAFRAVGTTGVEHDPEARKLRVRAAAAVDLAAPSADVARVRAEKQARALVEKRLRSALLTLGVKNEAANEQLGKLVVKNIDYMSDGAVVIEAELENVVVATEGTVKTEKRVKAGSTGLTGLKR